MQHRIVLGMLVLWLLAIAAMDSRQAMGSESPWYLIWLGGLSGSAMPVGSLGGPNAAIFIPALPEALLFAALVGLVRVWNLHRAVGEHSAEVIERLIASLGGSPLHRPARGRQVANPLANRRRQRGRSFLRTSSSA